MVQKVSLDSGVQMAGQVGLKDKDNKKSTCNHAGGIALTPKGLFVSDTKTLWLLNPAKIGSGDAVKRTWALKGVNGSFLAMPVNGNVGIGSWKKGKAGKVSVFSLNGLMAKKITTLVDKKKKPKEEGDPPLGKQLTPVRADYKPVAVNANGGSSPAASSSLPGPSRLAGCCVPQTAASGSGQALRRSDSTPTATSGESSRLRPRSTTPRTRRRARKGRAHARQVRSGHPRRGHREGRLQVTAWSDLVVL